MGQSNVLCAGGKRSEPKRNGDVVWTRPTSGFASNTTWNHFISRLNALSAGPFEEPPDIEKASAKGGKNILGSLDANGDRPLEIPQLADSALHKVLTVNLK